MFFSRKLTFDTVDPRAQLAASTATRIHYEYSATDRFCLSFSFFKKKKVGNLAVKEPRKRIRRFIIATLTITECKIENREKN
jgi:hypothetical protein